MEENQDVELTVKLAGVDEAAQKVTQLAEKIREVITLAGELASMLGELEVKL